ncbi:hypothetical protein [Paenibacillus wynnii]|uniref:hypothetical protein n=1 Tax=Paenibacillus wynnii TaxID=268407 RepID=UPI002794FE22|nr:hypothetical protein [Paenibacillus wynnii]MDQ0194838.1 hypothetical protein [Paenibacillus wynnii]
MINHFWSEPSWEPWIQALKKASTAWRQGDDLVGLASLQIALSQLEQWSDIQLDQKDAGNGNEITIFLSILRDLHQHLLNTDVIAITDLIESKILPFYGDMKNRVNPIESTI